MITEDYVSFEIAKLLKEKGFDEGCRTNYRSMYSSDPRPFYHNIPKDFNGREYEGLNSKWYSAPTLQMAMKWLREVHNIHIAVVPCEVGPGVMDYTYILYKVDTENFYFTDLGIQGRADTDKMSASKTCEAAIKYCLENLI